MWARLVLAVGLLVGCASSAEPRPVARGPSTPTPPSEPTIAATNAPPSGPARVAVPVDKRAAFRSARARRARGDAAAARAQLEAVRPVYPELEDYVLDALAGAATDGGDLAAAEAYWAALVAAHPRSVLAAHAQLERGRLLAQRGSAEGARAAFSAARDAGDDDTAMAATLALGDLVLADGDIAAAYAHAMAARRRAPGTPLAREAKRRVNALRARASTLAPLGAELESELALLLSERDYDAALAAAEALFASDPQPRWLRARADAEYGAGRVNDSLATLALIAHRYPGTAEAAEAQFRLASVLWNSDRNDEAAAAFALAVERYPAHARRAEALYALARIAQSGGREEESVARYTRLIEAAPASPQAHDGRWRIGWIRYQQGDWPRAAAAFAAAAQGSSAAGAFERPGAPVMRLRCAGAHDEASRGYQGVLSEAPKSYYALVAEQRLGVTPPPRRGLAAPTQRGLGPPPAGADPYHWLRARELLAVGTPREAQREMRAFERDCAALPAATAALPAAFQAVGGYRDAIRLASQPGDADPALLYPLAFWKEVSRSAAAETVDPLLVLALMRQESLFDPAARSPADARGLMQLLPSTALRIAGRRGMASPVDRLEDPKVNVALGVAYLGELLRRYDGDTRKALAAYNGGEEAVGRWQERFGHLPPDEFVESITYRETRDYVKRVLGHYRAYQRIYAR